MHWKCENQIKHEVEFEELTNFVYVKYYNT